LALQQTRPTQPRPAAQQSGDIAIIRFLRDTLEELRKVVWPTPNELYRYTVVVIVTVVVIGLFIGLVDFTLHSVAVKYIYKTVTK